MIYSTDGTKVYKIARQNSAETKANIKIVRQRQGYLLCNIRKWYNTIFWVNSWQSWVISGKFSGNILLTMLSNMELSCNNEILIHITISLLVKNVFSSLVQFYSLQNVCYHFCTPSVAIFLTKVMSFYFIAQFILSKQGVKHHKKRFHLCTENIYFSNKCWEFCCCLKLLFPYKFICEYTDISYTY